ncbi:MAG: TlpA disulfide reductase family protein [Bacteroidota bacterium]
MRIFLILFFVFIAIFCISQPVIIEGNSVSYAKDTLIFYTYDDYISYKEIEIGRTVVDDSGSFSLTIDIEKTILSHLYLGIYRGLLFLEPGQKYILKLPTKSPKGSLEKNNPYFKESDLYLGIFNAHKDELNFLIKKFDYYFDEYVKMNYSLIYQSSYKSDVDTALNELRQLFSFTDNKYFSDYMEYKFAGLRFMAYQRDAKVVTIKYFLNKPLLLNNIAYMEFFNQVYNNYFTYYGATKDGQNILIDIAMAKSPHHLKHTLELNYSLDNDTLKELVILKGLHDAFYSSPVGEYKSFPRRQLLQTLDSMIIIGKIPEFKKIAQNIKDKVTRNSLNAGDPAPSFELYDINNQLFNSEKLKGKYTYLAFYSVFNYTCMQEIGALQELYKNHNSDIEIVTIFCDGENNDIINFTRGNTYDWKLIHYKNQPGILNEYNIKYFPSYILIDPNWKIIDTTAPSPGENFQRTFLYILKSKKN